MVPRPSRTSGGRARAKDAQPLSGGCRPSPRLVLGLLGVALVIPLLGMAARDAQRPAGTNLRTLSDPIDPGQQTDLQFGERSHWLQPWRAYLDTVPAGTLRQGLGIDFNVPPERAAAVARLLSAAGFRRVRYEIGWCSLSYTNPHRISEPGPIETTLRAFRRYHLRPLILLNANDRCPGPLHRFRLHVTVPAHAGDRQLQLDSESVSRVLPSLTGLDSEKGVAAAMLFTRVAGTTVTLSQPLDRDLAPGFYDASTLRYQPFGQTGTSGFEQTLQGWVDYAGVVTREVKAVLGSDAFDVEVWNELSFGSDFLDVNRYYAPATASVDLLQTEQQILQRTVDYLRDPAHGVTGVGIGDGFASQRPWDSGANVPAGVTAIDKHPYAGPVSFPAHATFNKVRPLDARGSPEGSQDAGGNWHDSFVPRYTAFFPEYYLTGIQTENLVRDLSPITTDVLGVPHGRETHAPGAAPPKMWLTEIGLNPSEVPAAVLPRFKAKMALRAVTAWIGKGAAAVYLFAAGDANGPWGLVDQGAPRGGSTLEALSRLTRALRSGASQITRPASPKLLAVSDRHDHVQFLGDGTGAHPALANRDVVTFFPFQVSNRRLVVATYVMTRNLLTRYRPRLPQSNPLEYDLPEEHFRLTIEGVARLGRAIGASDPLTGKTVPVKVVSRSGNRVTLDIPLTDSPRLLTFG
ncbi:MAG: hypothetical protein ACXVZ1_03635 [Gaiellaceae bacterium]